MSETTHSHGNILITGCSSGIGFDAARTLHKRGWRVFATCRTVEDVHRLESMGMESFVLDYSDSDSVQQAAQEALQRTGGKIDALFNNGAYAIPGRVEDLPRQALRDIFETNVFGQFELVNLLLPSMHRNGRGRIIMNSSVLGFLGIQFRGAYVATKFAMEGLTDALRLELAESPVHVVLIEPGPIATRIRENSIPHFERWIDWENAHRHDLYESRLRPRLYQADTKKDRFELPSAAVTNCLIHALESLRPKPRYYVTTLTHLMGFAKRVLSTRLLDRLLMLGR